VTVVSELAYPTEVAQELRVSVGTVKRWLRNGFEGVRLPGGDWRIPWSEVERLRVRRRLVKHRPADRRPA
jgi:excisionase family DNA binding protein